MRKLFTLLIVLFLWAGSSWGQVGSYSFISSSGSYIPITGGTVIATATSASGAGSLDDVNYTLESGTIPFSFTFDGIGYTGLTINTNGYITFGATVPLTNGYTPISATTAYAGCIAAIGRDLNSLYNVSGYTGEIRYETVNSSPNREFVVQFSNFRPYSTSTTTPYWRWNFQIRLKEDNSINVVYDFNFNGTPSSGSGQVGLRGANNSFPANVSNRLITTGTHTWATSAPGISNSSTCSYSTTLLPASGLTFTWTPPVPCTNPTNQPTALLLTPLTTSVSGSFTAAAGSDSYLVIRTPDGLPTATPVNGTTYAIGATLGNATVVQSSAAVSFTASSLTAGTLYYFHVFSMNSLCSGGPLYLTTSPLVGSVTTAPNPPASITAAAISGSQIDLTTIANVAGNNIMIAWNTSNTFGTPSGNYNSGDPITGGGTVLNIAAAGTSNHTGLIQGTQYYYRAWSVAGGIYSSSNVNANATTLCSAAYPAPYSNNFDAAQDPDACWTKSKGQLLAPTTLTGTTSFWLKDDWRNVVPSTDKAQRLNIYGTGRYEWLITPEIDLGTGTYQLEFDLALNAYASSGPPATNGTDDRFAVVISTDGGVTWTSANTLRLWDNAGSSYVYNNISPDGERVIIPLSAFSGIIKIGFYGESTVSNADNDLMINNLVIQEPPATPEISIVPLSKNYGIVGVGETSAQQFTITNVGGGTLIINPAISITGTDADQFALTDNNSYPISLTGGQSASVVVTFTPTSAGDKIASLVIVDNLGSKATNTVPLSGNGFVRPAGSTCENPYIIASLPFNYTGTTEGFGDDYEYGWITPNSYYITGDDMVFEFTLTEAGYLGGSMTTTDSYLGLFILEDCPDPVSPAAVLRSATSSGTSVTLTEILLQPGTYFAIVSSWPSPQSIAFTLNLAFEPLPDCPVPTTLTATPASFSAVLGWTENGTATTWDIEWGAAGFTQGTGTTITGVANPYTLTALQPSTPYDYYVRADCGEGSVSDWSVVRNFTTLAACPAPTVLTATNISTTSAVLGWTENGTATSWDIEYGQTPFTPTGTPTISGVTNPYNLTGLSSGITYAYYVRAYCSETYQSTWSGPLSFTTQTVVSAPYTEGFITTSTPTGWTTTGWSIGSVRGATGNPGNNIYRNLWSSATTGTFTTINVGPVSSGMSLTFDYQLTNYDSPFAPPAAGSGNFIVSVSTDFGLNYTELETINNDGVAGWRSKSYDLSAYAGSNVKVRIVGNRTSGDYDLAFDNFYIGAPISCLAPTAVTVTAVTQTTATISWTAPDPAPANGYEYEVRSDGDPGSGPTGLAVEGNTAAGVTTANITGLEDGTVYMVYVRSVCGEDNYSNWTGGVQFVTACYSLNLPFTEDFEETSATIPCWSRYDADGGGQQWSWYSGLNHTPDGELVFGHQYGLSGYDEDGWLISPALIIPETGNTELIFWSYNIYPGDYFKNSVLISTGSPDPSDEQYTEIWTPESVSQTWVETVLDLNAYAGETIYIAFRYEGNYAHSWFIDDVNVENTITTIKTLNLKAYIEGFWNGSAMNQAQDVDEDENIFNKFSGTTVDTLSVYLAEADAPWAYLFAAHEVNINTDGSMVISVPAAFPGSYYIVIDHHSSVETWSALPVDFSGTTIDYDFTTAAGQAYGSNQQSMGTVWALYSGDVNDDEYIEFLDVVPIYNLSAAGFFGYTLFDIDGNGYIEFLDYIIAYNNSVNSVGMNTPPNPAKRPGMLKLKLTD
ncbi:MAG: choice-of-anchor J domain-containing protein [Lentimicrobium sp.]